MWEGDTLQHDHPLIQQIQQETDIQDRRSGTIYVASCRLDE
jgi:hypothetical protein